MTLEEYNKELERLIRKRDNAARCAQEEEDREYKADMYRIVDRVNDAISSLKRPHDCGDQK